MQPSPECPSEEVLAGYLANEALCEDPESIRTHIQRCPRCRKWLDDAVANDAMESELKDALDGSQRQDGFRIADTDDASSTETVAMAAGGQRGASGPLPSIPGYEGLRAIAKGGQGVVYQGIQISTKRRVAIKLMLDGAYASNAARKRFEREITLAAQLRHPNIVTIFDSGVTADGHHFYVMEYVRGLPLTEFIKQRCPSIEEALTIFADICEAVSFAHRKGVIHRDLKPSNILVDTGGTARVMDFGLAKQLAGPDEVDISLTGQIVGTIAYMSPEQTRANPDEIDARSDVYALGVILYEMLTGTYPYPVADNVKAMLDLIVTAAPTPPSRTWTKDSGVFQSSGKHARPDRCPIDRDVETIVLRALAKEPNRRYQNAADIAADLKHWLAHEPIDARRDSRVYVIKKKLAAHRRGFVSSIVIIVLCAALVSGSLVVRRQSRVRAYVSEARDILASDRSGLDTAAEYLERALNLNPSDSEALHVRGYLSVIRALAAELSEKTDHVDCAVKDFVAASEAAGSSANDAHLKRSYKALVSAATLLRLAGRNEEAARLQESVDRIFADLSPSGDKAELSIPIYVLDSDPLLCEDPDALAKTPEAMRSEPDRFARLRRVVRRPFRQTKMIPGAGSRTYPEDEVAELIFDRLFRKTSDGLLAVNDAMVESVKAPGDGVSWEINLRPGLKWHDDMPLTAGDVVFSFAHFFEDAPEKSELESVEAVDGLDGVKLRFIHKRKLASAHWEMYFPILPRHIFENTDGTAYERRPIGNGPYRLNADWKPDLVTLERWDEYPGEKAHFAVMKFEHIPDRAKRMRELAAGWIDVMELSPAEFSWDVNGSSFEEGLVKLVSKRSAFECIKWLRNEERNPLDQQDVRRALTKAINIEDMRQSRFGGLYTPFTGIYGSLPWVGDMTNRLLDYDPDDAAASLSNATWQAVGDSPARVRKGNVLTLTLLVDEASWGGRTCAQDIKERLQYVGVDVRIRTCPWEGEKGKECRDVSANGEVDAYISAFVSAADPAVGTSRWIEACRDDQVKDWFEAANEATDSDERIRLYNLIQNRIYRLQPYTFLWGSPSLWALNENLRGVGFGVQGITSFDPGPRAWWMMKDRD